MQNQFYMQKLVWAFYEEGVKALKDGANINALCDLSVREAIGRYKYTEEDKIEEKFNQVHDTLIREMSGLIGKEED